MGARDRDFDDAAVALFIPHLYGLLCFASVIAAFGADHTWMLRHYQAIFTEGCKAGIDALIIALLGMPLGEAIWRSLSEPLVILRTPVPGSESKLRNNGLAATHGSKH